MHKSGTDENACQFLLRFTLNLRSQFEMKYDSIKTYVILIQYTRLRMWIFG